MIRALSPTTKIVALSDDIHYLRNRQVSNNTEADCRQGCWKDIKKRESRIFRDSDLVLAISDQDQRTMQKMVHKRDNTAFDVFPFTEDVDFDSIVVPPFSERRRDLLYIGSKHEANEMAVKFILTEIFPSLRQRMPHVTLTLVGADIWPTIAKGIPGVQAFGKVSLIS